MIPFVPFSNFKFRQIFYLSITSAPSHKYKKFSKLPAFNREACFASLQLFQAGNLITYFPSFITSFRFFYSTLLFVE